MDRIGMEHIVKIIVRRNSMYGTKITLLQTNKLPKKNELTAMDYVYLGEPFVQVVSKDQNLSIPDYVYLAEPFVGK